MYDITERSTHTIRLWVGSTWSLRLYYFGVWQSVCVQVSHQWVTNNIIISIIHWLQVRTEFILTVNFINYTNPTGLCAECAPPLSSVASADQLVPVCCDQLPYRNTNCSNTGEERCDTRFRWTIRQFGATLETRPFMGYSFTDCSMSPSTCPFSEMSTTFGQGPAALLGVTENPLPASNIDFTFWTVSSCSVH